MSDKSMNIIQRVIRRCKRDLKIFRRKRKARRMGMVFVTPNFIYFPRFNSQSIIIDGGCGYQADLSVHMIAQYGLISYGIDPTHKHAEQLKEIEERTNGRFHHMMLAVSSQDGYQRFIESKHMESGSLFGDHTNALRHDIISYDVETVSLRTLLNRTGAARIDLLKLDLEGAEYEILEKTDKNDLDLFGQIFVEFHHHAVRHFSEKDTQRIVRLLCEMGLKAFSLDDHNYLFYKN